MYTGHTFIDLQKTLPSGQTVNAKKCTKCGAVMLDDGKDIFFNMGCSAGANEREQIRNMFN